MNRIRHWRELRGLSQAKLARMVGMSQPNLHKIEDGRQKLTVDMMRKIAKQLTVPPLDLLSIAITADLSNDAEPAAKTSLPDDALKVLAAQKMTPYRVMTNAIERAGFAPSATILVDQRKPSIDGVKTGDAVIAEVEILGSGEPSYVVLRQFIQPGLLTTNRPGRNSVIDTSDDQLSVRVIGVATPF